MVRKYCRRCDAETSHYANARPRCKPCQDKASAAYRETHREKVRASHRGHNSTYKKRLAARRKESVDVALARAARGERLLKVERQRIDDWCRGYRDGVSSLIQRAETSEQLPSREGFAVLSFALSAVGGNI